MALFKNKVDLEVERILNERRQKIDDRRKEMDEKRKEEEKKLKFEKAVEEVDKATASAQKRLDGLDSESKSLRMKAIEYMRAGNQAMARQEMANYRAYAWQMVQLCKTLTVMGNLKLRVENAQVVQQLSATVGNLMELVNMDPNATDNLLDKIRNNIDVQTDIDAMYEDLYKDATRPSRREISSVPSVDELMDELATELARGVVPDAPATTTREDDDIKRQVAQGFDVINRMLNENGSL